VTKLLILLGLCGALANGIARSHSEPQLLIDQQAAPSPLDASH
jgi:hypothetical protein